MKLKLAIALAAVAPAAFAQTFTTNTAKVAPVGNQTVAVGTLSSSTTVRAVGVNPYEAVFVYCQGSALTSQSLVYRVGTRTISTTAVACGTTSTLMATHAAGTIAADNILVSPTAGLTAANVVTNTIVKIPAIIR
jgi:hypothetical protein